MSTKNADKPLDDVMLAMDVVDTLRRDSRVALQELDAETRESELLDRLQSIYGTQGIEVSDEILKEGIRALREDRFTYKPTPHSLSRLLATLYVRRKTWWKTAFIITALVILSYLTSQLVFTSHTMGAL